MSLSASLLFSDGILIEEYAPQMCGEQAFICLRLADAGYKYNNIMLHFYNVEQIEKLMAALGNTRAAFLRADPAVVHLEHSPKFSRPLKPGETEPGVPPWPVAPGTDTTGWTDSQILGEQPPPDEPRDCLGQDVEGNCVPVTKNELLAQSRYGEVAFVPVRSARYDQAIELSPEPVDPWKERGEASDPAETPTDEIALPAPLPECRSCSFMLLTEVEVVAGICTECAAIAAKIAF